MSSDKLPSQHLDASVKTQEQDLGMISFEQEWGWGWPCYDTEFAAFQVQITLLSMLASTIARSASLQIKGLATKYTTVKWPIGDDALVA